MKLDLKNQIDTDIGLIIKEFKRFGCEHDDAERIKITPDKFFDYKELAVIISPIILHYEGMSQVWYACSFEIQASVIKGVLNFFLNMFKDFVYKPFRDDDAVSKYFAQYNYNTIGQPKLNIGNFLKFRKHLIPKRYITTGFFLNPDYPTGYWSNHIIDTIKL